MLSLQDKLKVNSIIKDASDSLVNYNFNYLEMKTLSQYEVVSLAERHLVSPEFASSRDGRALLITEDESIAQAAEMAGIDVLKIEAGEGKYVGEYKAEAVEEVENAIEAYKANPSNETYVAINKALRFWRIVVTLLSF